MADYYSILNKTISGLPNNTPEVRNAVFKKARTAIETQLRNMDPLPSEEAIASQLKSLEEAIVVIDAEYGGTASPEPVTQPVEETPVEQQPAPQAEAPVEPETPQPPAYQEPPASVETLDPIEASAPVEPIEETPVAAIPTTPEAVPAAPETAPAAPSIPTPPPVAETVVDRVESAIDKIQSDVPPSVGVDAVSPNQDAPNSATVAVDPQTKDILDPMSVRKQDNPVQAI